MAKTEPVKEQPPKKKQMGEVLFVFTVLGYILSFGTLWLLKLAIQKAITDAENLR